MVSNLFRFFLIFYALRIVFTIIFRTRLMKRQKNQANSIESTDKFPEAIEKETAIDMVYDEICQVYVPKSKAYQIVEDDKTHYFCSWECRQKYIDCA